MTEENKKIDVIIATDCGSTTTKAILFEKVGNEYRQTFRGEAPTTVEAPLEDVTLGVLNAIQEVEELSGRKILDGESFVTPAREEDGKKIGVDIYISTSSAGGGLQMVVAGVVRSMTGESAMRAALGGGAIVMDVLAMNDRRLPHEKVERIRQLRPDMILLAGGTDGGTVSHVVELAEYIAAADPKPRLGIGYKLPIVYAGNKDAKDKVEAQLGEKMEFHATENLRPQLEEENSMPARFKIQDLFEEHVMSQAPGYKKLMSWTGAPIMPTPAAVGRMMQRVAELDGINILGADIGGATTDVFSVFEGTFNRSVSANLGMSYSVSNVMAEAGLENVLRWVPFEVDEEGLRNVIKNKMIRPTTIPQLLEELKIEQALAKEALRLSLVQHKELAVSLKGVQQKRTISDVMGQSGQGDTIVNMMTLNLIIGSGGVLSHAPRRGQSLSMIIDSFEPEGITRIAVDSIFMMPHLGVLSEVNVQAAREIFEKDCLKYLGSCIAPILRKGKAQKGVPCMKLTVEHPDKGTLTFDMKTGEVEFFELGIDQTAKVTAELPNQFSMGNEPGEPFVGEVKGGEVGVVIDCRLRPILEHEDEKSRVEAIEKINSTLNLYPS